VELEQPRQAVEDAGAATSLLSIQRGEIQAVNSDIHPSVTFGVDQLVGEASVHDYDALILPGGAVNPDHLRQDEGLSASSGTSSPAASRWA
jgi:protease I